MDLTLQALQTNGKLFSNFGIIILISYNIQNNSGVGFMQATFALFYPFVFI